MNTRVNDTGEHEIIKLQGRVTRGIGQSALFTEIPWVKKQFAEKLGIIPYPGTFNITVVADDMAKLKQVRETKGIEIPPEDLNFCSANSLRVLINNQIKGAAIIPSVTDYPPGQLEIIAAEHVKESLALKDGDPVEVKVYL
ncbi:DUF120 domain-containing protein [Chloroflexota bacterium]